MTRLALAALISTAAASALANPIDLQPLADRAKAVVDNSKGVPAVAPASEPPAVCPAGTLKPVTFRGTEQLLYALDAFGANLGTFEMKLERAPAAERDRGALLIQARGKSSDIISSNVKRVDGWSSALIGSDGAPKRYREEVDEGDAHYGQDVDFPANAGSLAIRATRNGDPVPLALAATNGARDLLSGLFVLRRQDLTPGAALCAEIYAAKRMWRVEGKVADKPETVESAFGKVEAIRLDAVATRLDDAKVVRKAHVWVTTDDRRLPVVILGDIRGRFIRAQLTEAKLGKTKLARTASRD